MTDQTAAREQVAKIGFDNGCSARQAHDIAAVIVSQFAVLTRPAVRRALTDAWDDGNGTGLDGWVGPGRGMEPDEEGIYRRDRYVEAAVARFELPPTPVEAEVTGNDA